MQTTATQSSTKSSIDTPMPPSIRRKIINVSPFYLSLAVTSAHVFLSPYTKVEESFTLHAVHDVLAHGHQLNQLAKWDHVPFPGAVPRSFVPPILLGAVTYPFSALAVYTGWMDTKIRVQILLLATFFSASLHHLCRSIAFRFGARVKWWTLLLTLSSFHIPYYAGRTIPNFMALPIVLFGISFILRSSGLSIPEPIRRKRLRNAICLLTAVSTIVRLEIALFLLPVVLSLVIQRKLSLGDALLYGISGGVGSLVVSAPIDLYLWLPTLTHPSFPFDNWKQLVWPELSGLIFNVYNDKAADWGIMSKHYYFTNSLPKLLGGTAVPLAIGGLAWIASLALAAGAKGKQDNVWAKWTRNTGRNVGEVVWTFGPGVVGLVAGMSLIGHKEWRFIIYCVPVLVLIGAIASAALWDSPSSRLRPVIRLGLVGLVCANLLFTVVSTFLSVHNYPGGEVWKALDRVQKPSNDTLTIHLTSYPLQTGSSLFTFHHSPISSPALPSIEGSTWNYDRSEDQALTTPGGAEEAGVEWDVLVTEDWRVWKGKGWKLAETIEGLEGVERGGKFGLRVKWGERIGVLVRD